MSWEGKSGRRHRDDELHSASPINVDSKKKKKKKKNIYIYIYISHFYKTKYDRQDVLQDNKNVIIYHLRLRIELGRER